MRYRYCGIYFILVFFIRETRAGVLLTHLAKKIRKETGDQRYRARIEDERASLTTLILISCTRPVCEYSVLWYDDFLLTDAYLDLTLTEPIVTAFSVRMVRSLSESYIIESCSFGLALHGVSQSALSSAYSTYSVPYV